MIRYMVGGRSAASDATLDSVAAHLWNPSTARSIFVYEVWDFSSAATAHSIKLVRTTTAGTTPGSTVTPDIDNDLNRAIAPPSGALLYLANIATEPTVQGPPLAVSNLPAAVGAAVIWTFPSPITVPQSTGLGIAVPEIGVEIAIPISDFTFVWEE